MGIGEGRGKGDKAGAGGIKHLSIFDHFVV